MKRDEKQAEVATTKKKVRKENLTKLLSLYSYKLKHGVPTHPHTHPFIYDILGIDHPLTHASSA